MGRSEICSTMSQRLFLLLTAFASLLAAEFRSVEIRVGGIECLSCAASIEKYLRKIKGVESAAFRTSDAVALIALAPDNRVSLAEIRDALKRLGYTPQDAKVQVRGTAISESGQWKLRLSGTEQSYVLDPAGAGIEAGNVTVEGEIRPSTGRQEPEVLRAKTIKRE
ncbi:MAG: heavy-metal-associated domain-containing protein [Bryobacteraceae bacterium]